MVVMMVSADLVLIAFAVVVMMMVVTVELGGVAVVGVTIGS